MKAAAETWRSRTNVFTQGFANETRDPAIVAATMSKTRRRSEASGWIPSLNTPSKARREINQVPPPPSEPGTARRGAVISVRRRPSIRTETAAPRARWSCK